MANNHIIPTVLLVSCALLGGYGAFYSSYRDGLFAALAECIYPASKKLSSCKLHVPNASQMPRFTGFSAFDHKLALLVEFFQQGLPRMNPGGLESFADIISTICWTSQYGAMWAIISMEGLRRGNRGSVLAYTGIWGTLFQLFTVAIFAPVYFITQLFLSPTQLSARDAAIDPADLEAHWKTIILTYGVPTLGLILPLLGVMSPRSAYYAIALWQFFPLLKSAMHPVIRARETAGNHRQDTVSKENEPVYDIGRMKKVYRGIMAVAGSTFFVHLVTVLLSSQTSLPATLKAFAIPGSLTRPPTFALSNPPVSAAAGQDMIITFLKWDLYCAGAALLIWASAQVGRVLQSSEIPATIAQTLLLFSVGGPAASAASLLCKRDERLLAQPNVARLSKKRQ